MGGIARGNAGRCFNEGGVQRHSPDGGTAARFVVKIWCCRWGEGDSLGQRRGFNQSKRLGRLGQCNSLQAINIIHDVYIMQKNKWGVMVDTCKELEPLTKGDSYVSAVLSLRQEEHSLILRYITIRLLMV